jgi:hypothetical protein
LKYKKNPKNKGSGIVACIPQKDICPIGCEDCFFQSGRSYLEPLLEHLPNMPDPAWVGDRLVRVNDGNDSNVEKELVIESTNVYKNRFFNTSIPNLDFPAPVVLTVNPGKMTDKEFHKIHPIPKNLMYVRARTNLWNDSLIEEIVSYYTGNDIPVVLTFMAYHQIKSIPEKYRYAYSYRKRTLNPYYAIKTINFHEIMSLYADNLYVYSCGKIEGIEEGTKCKHCGNCLREYWRVMDVRD